MSIKLDVDVSQAQIENAIAVAIAEAFGPEKRDALLRDIVRAHLHYKPNSYDKETFLSAACGSIIREMAKTAIDKKMEELRPEVEEIVGKFLGPSFKKSVFSQLESAVSNLVVSNISINIVVDKRDDSD